MGQTGLLGLTEYTCAGWDESGYVFLSGGNNFPALIRAIIFSCPVKRKRALQGCNPNRDTRTHGSKQGGADRFCFFCAFLPDYFCDHA